MKFLHHEAKSSFEGGELEGMGSGEVAGNWTGSRPGCDFPVTMVYRGDAETSGRWPAERCQGQSWLRGGIAGRSKYTCVTALV